jgi:hypothetical protein
MNFLRPLTEVLRDGMRKYAIKMTAFNAAFKNIIKGAVLGTYPNFTIDYPNALIAEGSLPGALNPAAASTVAGTVHFTWDDNSDEGTADATDTDVLALYNPVKHQGVYFKGLAERADGTQTVTVPASWSGDLVHCFIYFNSADRQEVSNSKYAGVVTVA